MNAINQSTLLCFFNNFNTLKQSSEKLKKLFYIEAFEKLHKFCLKRKIKIKNFGFKKIQRHRTKPPKWLKKQLKFSSLINVDKMLDLNNMIVSKEFVWTLFYHLHKQLLNKHIDLKLLLSKGNDNENLRTNLRYRIGLIKINGIQQKRNHTRSLLMKYFNRWNFL
jgi:hypothetical protein